ncbi:MAG: hypothetical protein M3072_07620 [Candidatus Dormibacteraeota bacterium]|nr:hypothetical protein [Candidatus Dormibacteraeota bacterium]
MKPTFIRPTRAALALRGLVGLAGIALLGLGLEQGLGGQALIGLITVAAGAYAVMEVVRTPFSIGLEGGFIHLRGVFSQRCRLKEVKLVVLQPKGRLLLPTYRFLKAQDKLALETDATLWDRAQLERLLADAKLQVVRRR